MGFVEGISVFFRFWGTLGVVIGSLTGVWLLTGGLDWCRRQWRFMKYASTMPGPPALPIIGNALYFACSYNVKRLNLSQKLLDRIVQLGQLYDTPFRFWMGPKLFVIARDPRDIGVVMSSPKATDKPYEYRFVASYMGLGVATDSGSRHRDQRKLFLPMVNGKALNKFFECFDRQSRRCVECLENRVDTGEFDIMHFMDNYTLDIVLETVMGTAGLAQHDGYKGLMTCSARACCLAYERTIKGWLHPNWIYSLTNDSHQYAEDMANLHEFTDKLIEEKKKQYYSSKLQPDVEEDSPTPVLDRLIAHNEKTKLMDDMRLRNEITNIWLPAQDPTALTSSFLFVMLGMHPQVQEKARAEVREVIGDGDITPEHVSKLKYLEMVFKETVRLFPVGPIILRELQDDLDFETCTAPKGCTIALFVYMAHRDPKYWIEPEKFDPERFSPENSIGRHPYAYVPFSSGIRGCIGRNYATMMMKILVARVIQKYRIISTGSLETLRLKIGISIRAVDGWNVSITKV